MKSLLPILALSTCLATAALAQTPATGASSGAASSASAADKNAAAPATDEFVSKAAAGGLAEVKAGEIAARKATHKSVKNFGERMVKDHTKANQQLKSILAKEGKPAPSDQLDADGQQLVDKLNGVSGADFDRTYMDAMVEDHDKDVQEFAAYAKSGDDKRIKTFAGNTLKVIQHHDTMAHAIQKSIEKSAAR